MKTKKQEFEKSGNFLSISLGIAVVFVTGILIYSVVREKRESAEVIQKTIEEEQKLPKSHTVKDGESLWSIAVLYYKSGYNWVDLANTNNLSDPNYITTGQTLVIPDVKPIIVESGQISASTAPKHSQVTVSQGDSLWNIAVREYDSGYRWMDIAQINAIAHPDLIYPGTVLRLQ